MPASPCAAAATTGAGRRRKRPNGLSAQWLRSVSLRGVILRNSPRGIGGHFSIAAPPRVIGGLALLAGVLAGLGRRAHARRWRVAGSRWASARCSCCCHAAAALRRGRGAWRCCWPACGSRCSATSRWQALRVAPRRHDARVLLEGAVRERAGARGRRAALRCRGAARRRATATRRAAPRAPRVARGARGATRRRTLALAGAAGAASRDAQFHRHRYRALCISRPRAPRGPGAALGAQRAARAGARRPSTRCARASPRASPSRSPIRMRRRCSPRWRWGSPIGMSADQWRVFNATGTTHLVAISGLHVTLFALLALSRRARAVALCCLSRARVEREPFAIVVRPRRRGRLLAARRIFGAHAAHLADARPVRAGAAGGAARRRGPDLVAGADRRAAARSVRAAGRGLLAVVRRGGRDPRDRDHARSIAAGSRLRRAVRLQFAVMLALAPLTFAVFGGVSLAGLAVNLRGDSRSSRSCSCRWCWPARSRRWWRRRLRRDLFSLAAAFACMAVAGARLGGGSASSRSGARFRRRGGSRSRLPAAVVAAVALAVAAAR